jgi:valyl-tRNA synthetase
MGEVPFHTVFIHTRVLDEKGQKMSKTKGNVVDPLTLIDEYGADALRFTLALAAGQGRDMRIGASRVESEPQFHDQAVERGALLRDERLRHATDFDPRA